MRTMRTSNNEMLPIITLIGVTILSGTVQASETVTRNHKNCAVRKHQPSRKVYIT